jgi:hypothetical protein
VTKEDTGKNGARKPKSNTNLPTGSGGANCSCRLRGYPRGYPEAGGETAPARPGVPLGGWGGAGRRLYTRMPGQRPARPSLPRSATGNGDGQVLMPRNTTAVHRPPPPLARLQPSTTHLEAVHASLVGLVAQIGARRTL